MFELFQAKQNPKMISQASSLRLLIIEDVVEDIERMIIALESANIRLTYDVAVTVLACQRLLNSKTYDAILSDYQLAELESSQALNILQESGQHIPFILVTGSLGEEAAVECIKAGMTDYVLKDRLFRLPTVLDRSLQEFMLQRQQQEAIIQIQRQAQQEAIINHIFQAMRGTLVLDEVLQTTVDQLHEFFQVSRCLIFRPSSHQELYAAYVSHATAEREKFLGMNCEAYENYQEVLNQGKQLVFSQIDVNVPPIVQAIAQKYNIASIVVTPLMYQQSYLGEISLQQCDQPRQWTESELALVKAIADHCAIALHQAELYQQTQIELMERKRVEIALRESEQRFRVLIENATDIIVILDQIGGCRYVSPSVKRILGYHTKIRTSWNIFDVIHPDDLPLVTHTFHKVLQHPGLSQPAIEFRVRHRQGFWCSVEAVATNLLDDSAVQGIVVNCHDITKRQVVEAQLLHDALHDGLTGLPNRTLFMERLDQCLKYAERRKNYLFAVLFLDLDRFKVVNDSLGHIVGDQLLIAVSQRLQQCLRTGDTVARLGGDEFAILLEGITSINDAIIVANRLQKQLNTPIILDGNEMFITASIGIALSSPSYDQPTHLLRDADTAMYHAKERGRCRYEVFQDSMHADALKLLQLETDLRRAIERQEFEVYYQPIISLTTNQLEGFEALVRWRHPERGLVFPGEFIPVAEETGLIVPIGRWVLWEACRQTREWQQKFQRKWPLKISVNLSVKQFSQVDLVEQIDQILQETQLEGSSLKLEITESVIMKNDESITVMLAQLRDRNIQLCIDDFGTGYCSLSYLYRFPTHTLKIDRSFVSRMGFESEIQDGIDPSEIVRSIVTLSHNLGMSVVAEGVETHQQLEQLKALQCDYGQGYLFSKALDTSAATYLIIHHST